MTRCVVERGSESDDSQASQGCLAMRQLIMASSLPGLARDWTSDIRRRGWRVAHPALGGSGGSNGGELCGLGLVRSTWEVLFRSPGLQHDVRDGSVGSLSLNHWLSKVMEGLPR